MNSEFKMQGYQRTFDDHDQYKDEETIVVDLVPPQYQLSPPHSPVTSAPKSPEKGLLIFLFF